jgi:hypothetical protein
MASWWRDWTVTTPKVEIRIDKLALRLRGVTPAAAGELSRGLGSELSARLGGLDTSAAAGGQVSVLDAGRIEPTRPGDGGSLSRSVGAAVAGAIGAQLANRGPEGEGS